MFTAKISYKILNRSCEKDVWRIILQFLLNELVLEERSDNSKDSGDMRLKDVCPVMSQFQKMVRKYNGYGSDILSIWNNEFHPIGRYDDNMTTFKFHLRAKNMESFLKMEKYSDKFNIFSSFYDHASSQLAKHIEANTNSNTTNGPHTKTLHEETLSGPVMTAIPVNDLVISEFDMIQDIFDPLDFVSFF